MLRTRVMPCLLLRRRGLVKTVKFKDANYVGDPINTVRIFNEKEVDELIFLDIQATPDGRPPQFELLGEIADECFMPFTYGGGLRTLDAIERVLKRGAEKVALNTIAHEDPYLVRTAARRFGRQSIVASIDAARGMLGKYRVFTRGGSVNTGEDPVTCARRMEDLGAGEILLTSMDRDGTLEGYDLELIRRVTEAVGIPVIACGGAGGIEDFVQAVKGAGASAVAAGSLVVYQGRNRAVLVGFPEKRELKRALG
jgi:cyclase